MLQNKVCLEHMLKMAPSSMQAPLYASLQIGEDIGNVTSVMTATSHLSRLLGRQLFAVYCCIHGPSVNPTRRNQVASGLVILAATDFSKLIGHRNNF
jgi:hypothetical protein